MGPGAPAGSAAPGVTSPTGPRGAESLGPGRRISETHVELVDEIVVGELAARAALVFDAAVDDHVAAVGDADRLVEVLLRHEHREPAAFLELADLVDGAAHEERRQAHR